MGTPTARRTVCATIHWMHTDFVVLVVCLVFLYVMSLASHTSFTPYLIVCHEVLKNFLEPDQCSVGHSYLCITKWVSAYIFTNRHPPTAVLYRAVTLHLILVLFALPDKILVNLT